MSYTAGTEDVAASDLEADAELSLTNPVAAKALEAIYPSFLVYIKWMNTIEDGPR